MPRHNQFQCEDKIASQMLSSSACKKGYYDHWSKVLGDTIKPHMKRGWTDIEEEDGTSSSSDHSQSDVLSSYVPLKV